MTCVPNGRNIPRDPGRGQTCIGVVRPLPGVVVVGLVSESPGRSGRFRPSDAGATTHRTSARSFINTVAQRRSAALLSEF